MEDDNSDCDYPTGGSCVSGNEDLGPDSDSDHDSEVEITDAEDLDLEEAVFDRNAFEMLLVGSQEPGVFEEATFPYQRHPDPSLRTVQRKEKAAKELQDAAEGSKEIYTYFQNPGASNSAGRSDAWLSSDQLRCIERQNAIKALDKKLRKKTTLKAMNGQKLVRHQAVILFAHAGGEAIGRAPRLHVQNSSEVFWQGYLFRTKTYYLGNRMDQNAKHFRGKTRVFCEGEKLAA